MNSVSTSRLRRSASLAAGIALSLLVFVAVGEVLARRLALVDRMNTFPRQLYLPTADSDLAYTLRPGIRVTRQARDGEFEVRVNRLGFRGAEIDEKPAPGVHRVLVLGDSVAFGEGLRESDSFPTRLEAELNDGRAGAYQVVNAGVSGYNTAAEAALLRHRGIQLQPQTIVLAVSFNDFGPTPIITASGVLSQDETRPLGGSWLREHSEFFMLLEWLVTYVRGGHAFQKLAAAAGPEASQADILERIDAAVAARHMNFYRQPGGVGWQGARTALEEIRDLASANESRLLVVLFPEGFQVPEAMGFQFGADAAELAPQRAWLGLCADLGLSCLDLLPFFLGVPERPLFLDTQHPNALGHRLAARAVARALTETESPVEGGGAR